MAFIKYSEGTINKVIQSRTQEEIDEAELNKKAKSKDDKSKKNEEV